MPRIDLVLEKKKLELKKVIMGRDEMQFKILERMSDIERLEENIKISEKRIDELTKEIKGE